ncbi:TetR/AcrR family transcriptional regulator [Pseudonocardia sp. HH130630-07]|uniref:TetR/AcrR family transcriptional regulator n=1 Tax=Pseudonocardia sp. HH130630-07 TaxID=1690815 RepID=UPI000814BFFB|nr:TetR/AcrR family transcriptional regulator [Pseudonocardia sp. HH130630-07]ANY05713.1 hypothetical protein AFB00_04660 [Pseudonocardia sp. HH130630-07]
MTGSVNRVTSEAAGTGDDRMDRVLDAAAELLVRQGYRRVTIEDVARRAGVGKGTVYLHVRTKDALLLTVVLRSQRRLFADLADRMAAEPEFVLPWRMIALIYERMQADAVTRAMYLGDAEVLGRLAHEAAGTLGELAGRRDTVVREHFGALRDAGLVDTDTSVDDQIHTWGAVTYGFFVLTGMSEAAGQQTAFAPTDADRRIALLERAVRSVLTTGLDGTAAAPPPSAALGERVAGLYRPLAEHLDTELRRRVR